MKKLVVNLTLGFEVEVEEDGTFILPERPYRTSELKVIAREINRQIRQNIARANVDEVT